MGEEQLLSGKQHMVGPTPSGQGHGGNNNRGSRRIRRVERSIWVPNEAGGEGDGGDSIHGVEGKGDLSPKNPSGVSSSQARVTSQ